MREIESGDRVEQALPCFYCLVEQAGRIGAFAPARRVQQVCDAADPLPCGSIARMAAVLLEHCGQIVRQVTYRGSAVLRMAQEGFERHFWRSAAFISQAPVECGQSLSGADSRSSAERAREQEPGETP